MQKKCYDYPIEFVDDVFGESPVLADILNAGQHKKKPRIVIIADYNVVQQTPGLGAKIGKYVNDHFIRLVSNPMVASGGEKIKADSLQTALAAINMILEARLGKCDAVIALGGGALLDVAGYAASQVRGGVNLIRIPTTPLAMMDSSYADYAAVDTSNVKDALRVPSKPMATLIDTSFARTVLEGVWCAGFCEAIRQAVPQDAALFRKLVKLLPDYKHRDDKALRTVVESVCKLRMKKGATGFALWSANRMQAMSSYKLPHGYAVPIGIVIEALYAKNCGYVDDDVVSVIQETINGCDMMDSFARSQHILCKTESLLFGLDAWALVAGSPDVTVLNGIGKSKTEVEPDKAAYENALKAILIPPNA